MGKRFLVPLLLLALAASVLAAGVREGSAPEGDGAVRKDGPAAAPAAAAPAPAPARRAKVRIHRGAVESTDPTAATLTLRSAGKGDLLTFPVGPAIALETLNPGDNVAVTVKDGLATSVRPFRHVPKGLRDAHRNRRGKVVGSPAVPSLPPPSRLPPPN